MQSLLRNIETAVESSTTHRAASKSTHRAALAFAEVLQPLAEALADLGHVREQFVALTTPGLPHGGAELTDFRNAVRAVIGAHLEAVQETLGAAAGELRATAIRLAPHRTTQPASRHRASRTEGRDGIAAPPPTTGPTASHNRT